MGLKFRRLEANEIECRVAMERADGISLVLYKDARCDMRLLDEVVGPMNWQRRHYEQAGTLFGEVGIYNGETGQWVWKGDAGAESNVDAKKGQSSDSFKRACTNWGIGRELYTAPFIWIKPPDYSVAKSGSRKGKCNDSFEVSRIDYDEFGHITKLQIISTKLRRVVYAFGLKKHENRGPDEIRDELPICPGCGQLATGVTLVSGEKLTRSEVLDKYGMCAKCYQKKQAKEKAGK